MNKIVVFTENLSYDVRKGIVEIHNKVPGIHILIAHQKLSKSISKLLYNQWVLIRKNGWQLISYRLKSICNRILNFFYSEQKPNSNYPGYQYLMESVKGLPNLQYFVCNNLHEEGTVRKISSYQPDLGISLAAPILKELLFNIPLLGTINLHKGKLPFYRGMPPAFWELWNNEIEVGCTIHKIEAGLDTGKILLESTIPTSKFSTVKGMQILLDEMGVLMTIDAINLLAKGNPGWKKQEQGGKTFRNPTLKLQSTLSNRLTNTRKQRRVKHFLKEFFFFCYSFIYRPIPSLILAMRNKQRINVVLYHRVNDDMRDSVTVGIEQFDIHMSIIAKRYTVVSIESIVAGNIPRNSLRPIIAITFDDGYLDNYENAVPVLLKHQIPAAFFVSTGKIGTVNGFEHDLKKLGRALPNMNWQQVYEMKQHRFTIGSHTVSHINCGKDDVVQVKDEISKSKEMLESRLAIKNIIFAYPYGKKEDFNDEILESVKKEGYIGCTSAYGGCNGDKIDPFNVLRMGIDSNFTVLAFRARLEGFEG